MLFIFLDDVVGEISGMGYVSLIFCSLLCLSLGGIFSFAGLQGLLVEVVSGRNVVGWLGSASRSSTDFWLKVLLTSFGITQVVVQSA